MANGRKNTLVCHPQMLDSCKDCVMVRTERTQGAGYAIDYICTAIQPERKAMGYVEWDSDLNEVPEWCPHREQGNKS